MAFSGKVSDIITLRGQGGAGGRDEENRKDHDEAGTDAPRKDGLPAAPDETRLWLLPSGPDQVHGPPVHRARPCAGRSPPLYLLPPHYTTPPTAPLAAGTPPDGSPRIHDCSSVFATARI